MTKRQVHRLSHIFETEEEVRLVLQEAPLGFCQLCNTVDYLRPLQRQGSQKDEKLVCYFCAKYFLEHHELPYVAPVPEAVLRENRDDARQVPRRLTQYERDVSRMQDWRTAVVLEGHVLTSYPSLNDLTKNWAEDDEDLKAICARKAAERRKAKQY